LEATPGIEPGYTVLQSSKRKAFKALIVKRPKTGPPKIKELRAFRKTAKP